MLSEAEGYDILRKYDVPVPEYQIVKSGEDAANAAERMGCPVVMKIISPQIIHKSDAGGVIVGIGGKKAALGAFTRSSTEQKPTIPVHTSKVSLSNSRQSRGSNSSSAARPTPRLARSSRLAWAGRWSSSMKDVTLRILPISEDEIRQMIREINAYPLIAGYRGAKPRDEESLVKIIANIARFFCESENVVEFDVNPLRLYENGACAVDVRIITSDEIVAIEKKERIPVPIEYFTPRSIAVIGASQDSSKMGYAVMHNLLHFPGQLYPVNNKRSEIQGLKAFHTITAIPAPVDLAVITVPAIHVPRVIEECGQKGVPMVVIITAGFQGDGP